MKNIWRNIHLWLGLAAGLIFFAECISGTMLVFEDEITEALHSERYTVLPGQSKLMLDQLVDVARAKMPKASIERVKVYADPLKTVEVTVSTQKKPAKKNKQAPTAEKKKSEKLKIIYLNPYTATITAIEDPKANTFFTFMLSVHRTLLAGEVGKTVIGISTFMVFTILITGIVLWFPKKRKQLRARLGIKTDASWKRINHDLHLVLGFYCTIFIFIFLLSSLSWSFKWANKALYTLTGSKPPLPDNTESVSAADNPTISYQRALEIGKKRFSRAPYWTVAIPKKTEDALLITSASTDVLHRNGFDNLYIDQRTGAVLKLTWFKDMPGGWQLRRYMKPVHTGAIGGIPTKLIAFLVSLISASFPVTGMILWLNRIRKQPKKKKLLTTT